MTQLPEDPRYSELEKMRIEGDLRLRQAELDFERMKWEKEQEKLDRPKSRELRLSPMYATIAVAVIGLIGTGIGALLQGRQELDLEREKLRSQLILNALNTRDTHDALNFLGFLQDMRLVDGLDAIIDSFANNPEDIPLRPTLPVEVSEEITSIVDRMNSTRRSTRINATNVLVQHYTSNPVTVGVVLDLFDPASIEELTDNGGMNALVYLSSTDASAWSSSLVQQADSALALVERRHDAGIGVIGDVARDRLSMFKTHLEHIRGQLAGNQASRSITSQGQ